MVLGSVGWDKKELLKSNLHVYGRDNTKIVIYIVREGDLKGGLGKNHKIEVITLWVLVTVFIIKIF